MENSQREFLLLLSYLYVRYKKYDEALLVLKGLKECLPDDPEIAMALAHAYLRTERFLEAHGILEKWESLPLSGRHEKLFYQLLSRVLWALGRDVAARDALIHFLGIEEQELRLQGYQKQWLFSRKGGEVS